MVVLAFAADAAALVLYLLDGVRGGDHVRGLLGPHDPRLAALTSPFNEASQVAVLLLASGLVLVALLLWRVRRVLFALMGLSALLVIGAMVWALNPSVAQLRYWFVEPISVAPEALNVILVAASGVCLAASVAGWVRTPAGPDWFSVPIPRRATWPPPPPQTHQD